MLLTPDQQYYIRTSVSDLLSNLRSLLLPFPIHRFEFTPPHGEILSIIEQILSDPAGYIHPLPNSRICAPSRRAKDIIRDIKSALSGMVTANIQVLQHFRIIDNDQTELPDALAQELIRKAKINIARYLEQYVHPTAESDISKKTKLLSALSCTTNQSSIQNAPK